MVATLNNFDLLKGAGQQLESVSAAAKKKKNKKKAAATANGEGSSSAAPAAAAPQAAAAPPPAADDDFQTVTRGKAPAPEKAIHANGSAKGLPTKAADASAALEKAAAAATGSARTDLMHSWADLVRPPRPRPAASLPPARR